MFSNTNGEMMTPFKLLVRPKPLPQEALISYLIRVAGANGYANPRQLWLAARKRSEKQSLDQVMEMLGVRNDWKNKLYGPIPHYWKSRGNFTEGLDISDYNHHYMRWCPICLEGSGSISARWGVKLQSACLKHQIMLVDQCPACNARQPFEKNDLRRCCCGATLTNAELVNADDTVCRINRWLIEGSKNESAEIFNGLSPSDWHRLVRYLGQFSEDSQPKRPGQISKLHQLEVAEKVIQNTARLLENWPRQFNSLLAAIQRQEAATSLRGAFGKLYGVLYRGLEGTQYQFLRDAFEAYIHENWWGLVCRRNRSLKLKTVESHPRLTLQGAAKQAGTSPSVVRHLAQSELIPWSETKLASGRRTISVHQNEIEKITQLADGAVTLKEVAKLLALPKRRVKELVEAGVLTPVISKKATESAFWLFSKVEIARFLDLSGVDNLKENSVPFIQILKSWRLREGEFPELVKGILAGELLIRAPASSPIGVVSLDEQLTRSWLLKYRAENNGWFSIDQAGRLLGVKQQVAYELVKKGLLKTGQQRGNDRAVSGEDLEEFKSAYVSLAELAKKNKCSSQKLLDIIPIEPAIGPTIDGSRQYFFRKNDIANILQYGEC